MGRDQNGEQLLAASFEGFDDSSNRKRQVARILLDLHEKQEEKVRGSRHAEYLHRFHETISQ